MSRLFSCSLSRCCRSLMRRSRSVPTSCSSAFAATARPRSAPCRPASRPSRDRGEQQQLLSRARAALAEQKAEAERLKAEFDRQEAELAEQEKLLAQRVGHLGELFGVVRQSAGDIAGQWQDSLLNAQYPERLKQLRSLAESRALPSADDLDAFWMTLLEDLAASGRRARATSGGGHRRCAQRAAGTACRQLLRLYQRRLPALRRRCRELLVPPRQPSGKGLIEDYLKAPMRWPRCLSTRAGPCWRSCSASRTCGIASSRAVWSVA